MKEAKKAQKYTCIYSSCPFSGKKEGERELWEWKRRVRETYENYWLSGRKKHSKNTEDYRVK